MARKLCHAKKATVARQMIPACWMHELAQHHSEFAPGKPALYNTAFVMVMNKARYASLPADLRKVISVDGQKFTGFAVGDEIVLTNFSGSADGITAASKRPSVNVNTAATPYIITSIASDGSWVKFDRDLKAEANIAINLRQNIILKWVQVQLRDDLNITVTGSVKGTAGGDTFLSSEGDIRLDLVTSGAAARIKAGDNLISFDVGEFVDFFEERGDPVLAAYDVGLEAGQIILGGSFTRPVAARQGEATGER